LSLAVLLLLPGVSMAQAPQQDGVPIAAPRCRAYPAMVEWLHDNFNEFAVGHGLSADGTLLEVYASLDGSFTALKITPQGGACIVDFGDGWQMRRDPIEGTALGGPDRL
jgi:hypothetical protein